MKKTTLLLLILSCCQIVISQTGNPDPGFGTNGAIKTYSPTPGPNSTAFGKEGILQADGKLILGLQVNGKTRLTRRLADGNIDVTYGNNGYSIAISMIITAGAMQADGKIVVAGSTNGFSDFMLAKYNTDGTLDASFGNSGIVITQFATSPTFLIALAIAADGKIIAAGHTGSSGVVVRYNNGGTIDNGFGVNGIVTTSFPSADASSIQSLALQQDGKIIAAGVAFTTNFGDFAIARYNTDGSPDLSFNGTGQVRTDFTLNDWVRTVVVGNDGKIYAGGQSVDGSGTAHFTVARYNSNGLLDTDFNAPAGYVTTVFGSGFEFLTNIMLQQDGKIIAAGHLVPGPSGGDVALLRINTNGTIDNSFGTNGNGQVISDINAGDEESVYLEIQPDGKIITGGSSTSFTTGFQSRYTGFRYNADGTPDAGFGTGGFFAELLTGAFFQYTAVHQLTDGKVLAVSETSGETSNTIALNRFLANGSPDNSFGQNGILALPDYGLSFFQPDGKLLRLGFSQNINGDIALFRNNADGTPDAGFGNGGAVITDFGGIESATAATFQPDGKIIIGGLARDDNGSDFLVVRYNVNGTVDASFGNNGFARVGVTPEESVTAIAVAPDGKIVFGGTGITFPPHHNFFRTFTIIAKLNANGSIDAGFGDQGKKIIDQSTTEAFGNLAIQADNKIVFTSFITENPTQISFLGRLNTDGSADNSFGQNGTVNCDGYQIAVQDDQKILVFGPRRNNLNNTEFVLSRFTTDGNPDPSFGNNGQTAHSFAALDNQFFVSHFAGNNLYVAGAGVDEFGSTLGMIAKFIVGCPSPDITAISVSPTSLWPPNHTMKDIAVNYTISGTCALADTQIVVSSNEPVQTGEPGDLAPDWQIVNDHLVKVRAERSINGNGRIYTIKVIVTDINGNKDSATATVTVPKSQGNPGDQNLLITVYPNPSPNLFNVLILSKSNEKIKVRVFNNSGKVIRTIGNVKPHQLFRIGEELRKGIYFIEATQNGVTKTTKIIKL